MNPRWKVKSKPASVDTRFEFDSYEILTVFLDDITEHTSLLKHNPNISFGKGYVSVVIYPLEAELGEVDFELAKQIDECYNKAVIPAIV